jgi:hypothetical protein
MPLSISFVAFYSTGKKRFESAGIKFEVVYLDVDKDKLGILSDNQKKSGIYL